MASGNSYTHRYDSIITDIPRKTKCVDDTALWDTSLKEHWWRMIDFLELVGRKGIILNPTKFQFAQKEIDFAGFHIAQEDVKPLDKYSYFAKQVETLEKGTHVLFPLQVGDTCRIQNQKDAFRENGTGQAVSLK